MGSRDGGLIRRRAILLSVAAVVGGSFLVARILEPTQGFGTGRYGHGRYGAADLS